MSERQVEKLGKTELWDLLLSSRRKGGILKDCVKPAVGDPLRKHKLHENEGEDERRMDYE